ncbi:MAG: hypothetical protein ACRYFW_17300 [Janthinobacterium lividum]
MAFLTFLSPRRAVLDLSDFLSRRRPHQFVFATAAVAFTGLALFEIAHDAHYVSAYHRNIIYVQQWRADRSEAAILAQQKVDQAADDKRQAEIDRALAKRQAEFKRVDDSLKKYGI